VIVRSVQWDGSDAAWEAIRELYDEHVAFRDGPKLDAGTPSGQVPVLIGQWVIRRGDEIEVLPSARAPGRAAPPS
jgi:hypothetical protein